MMTFGCGCREISRTPIEFKIQECPQVHINCGPLLPNTNDEDFNILQNKIICDFKKVIKQLECGIQPDIEIILEEISLLFMNGCGYNVTKKMYSTDIEDDYFLRHNNFLSEFSTQEEKDQVLLNLGIYDKINNMVTEDKLIEELNTKIGFVVEIGEYYYGFASDIHYSTWTKTGDNNLILGKWLRPDYLPISYTIVFNNIGGDHIDPIIVAKGMSFDFPEPTYSSDSTKRFIGWFTDYNETTGKVSGTQYNAGDRFIPTQGMEFYAKWERKYTVTFNSNYVNGPSQTTVIVDYNTPFNSLIFPNLTREDGYIMKGWNVQLDGSGQNPTNITMDITLYAQWELGYKYKLSTEALELEPEWNYSNKQQITLKQLVGWNNWKGQPTQYIILPKQDEKSAISDYIDILDMFNQSIIEDFNIVNINNIMVVIKQIGFSPLDDSDENVVLKFKI